MADIAHPPDVERAIALFLRVLREAYPVADVRLYGSRARGDATPDSDVDLAIVFHGARRDRWTTVRDLANIAFDVLTETGVAVSPYPLWQDDLDHPERASNPALIQNIQRDGVPL